jgi:hypothetical protein
LHFPTIHFLQLMFSLLQTYLPLLYSRLHTYCCYYLHSLKLTIAIILPLSYLPLQLYSLFLFPSYLRCYYPHSFTSTNAVILTPSYFLLVLSLLCTYHCYYPCSFIMYLPQLQYIQLTSFLHTYHSLCPHSFIQYILTPIILTPSFLSLLLSSLLPNT